MVDSPTLSTCGALLGLPRNFICGIYKVRVLPHVLESAGSSEALNCAPGTNRCVFTFKTTDVDSVSCPDNLGVFTKEMKRL